MKALRKLVIAFCISTALATGAYADGIIYSGKPAPPPPPPPSTNSLMNESEAADTDYQSSETTLADDAVVEVALSTLGAFLALF